MVGSKDIAATDVPAGSVPASAAICVDLDGTLVKSDTLVDSVLVLARLHPGSVLLIPGWIAQGRAAFKRHVTSVVTLRVQRGLGRRLYLATAADTALAERVAEHVGIFDGVLASDGATNLAGGNKLAAFRERFGENFCYIGNALPDAA
jgi:hypothetical protein